MNDKEFPQNPGRFHWGRGNGSLDPGAVGFTHPWLNAFRIAKSMYQTRPDVFSLAAAGEKIGMSPDEVGTRLERLIDQHLVVLLMDVPVQRYGWGLYWWTVSLPKGDGGVKGGVPKDVAAKLLVKDPVHSVDLCRGDFDLLCAGHVRVLDNLLAGVIDPIKYDCGATVRLLPVRREIRECRVNLWDHPEPFTGGAIWADGLLKNIALSSNLVDEADLQILRELNSGRPNLVDSMFDFATLSEISGMDSDELRAGLKTLVEERRLLLPVVYLNAERLGLSSHTFLIRLFQTTNTPRKRQIVDEIAKNPEFGAVIEFGDAYDDILVQAYAGVQDIDGLRHHLESFTEVEQIREADSVQTMRKWGCRLDDGSLWEQCQLGDDFLQDYAERGRGIQ